MIFQWFVGSELEYQVDKLEYKGGWVAGIFASMGNFTIRSPEEQRREK
jgi:hypothetical protein